MRLFKKQKSATFPINLLGKDNLSEALQNDTSPSYSFPVGKDKDGKYIYTNLQQYAHLVAAGQTGSGMAVFQDTMLTSLMYKNTPKDLKLILIDPKQVSLSPYKDSPYLQMPRITTPEQSENAMEWLRSEIERRFEALTKAGNRDIFEYNSKHKDRIPVILLVIDEIADLMMVDGKFYEGFLVWMMQRSRAVGVFCFIGTHRTAEEILPGMIRANAFVKLAFTLPNKESSEFMIDQSGAENLNGRGDLLFSSLAHDSHKAIRLQAPFISDENLMKVIEYTSR
jgi:S-DNA-T family DNA segregation ATPase FtsK/SpoIIIE